MHNRWVLFLFLFTLSFGAASVVRAEDEEWSRLRRRVAAVNEAELLVKGRVVETGKSPGVWSGTLATFQKVTYRVQEIVAGEDPGKQITVEHRLVSGSLLVDADEARLNPDLFAPGREFFLTLTRTVGTWRVEDEAFGAFPLDESVVDDPLLPIWETMLNLPWLQPFLHPESEGRVPVVLEETRYLLPHPRGVEKFGQPVSIRTRARIQEAGTRAYLKPTKVEVTDRTVKIRFVYPIEGVVGHATLAREEGRWIIKETHGAER